MQSSVCTQNIPEFLQENWLQMEPIPKKKSNNPTTGHESSLFQTYSQVAGTLLLIFPHKFIGNIISANEL